MLANSTTSALTGQKVILTGASSGIGQAIAQKLLGVGAKVALLSRQAPSLAEANHPQALAVAIDLADVTKVRAQILATVAELGGVDILINNAGSAYIGELATIELHQWQQLFDLNVTSVLQCIQGVLPAMRQQQKGTILNVASVAAKQGFPNWGAYCATKFAL
ncbi:MAG: SDR family NAD(P)-dependent oxidoreductase, partial [Pseudanabaena sp. ELA607]